MLAVGGAGMAGLVAAARARELGRAAVVYEKGDRPGGSMLLSSCVIWRHRTLELFAQECPHGDPALQRLVHERLDDALDWLESRGVELVRRETANPLTLGRRYDPRQLTAALVPPDLRLRTPFPEAADGPLVLASGGFSGSRELVREFVTSEPLPVRGNPWSTGDGWRHAVARGAAGTAGMDEFYGRALPAPPARIGEERLVEWAQVWGKHALVVDLDGGLLADGGVSWHETELVRAIARRREAQAWLVADARALGAATPYGTVEESAARAEQAGGEVRRAASLAGLGLELPPSARLREPPFLAVRVVAAITHTIGGLRVDERARVLDESGRPLPGLYAAGVDAGGVAAGGYASGLAAALVLGLAAAEAASG